jgi:signal transduction histidine kinase/ligand-binding sensor domain-containing protein
MVAKSCVPVESSGEHPHPEVVPLRLKGNAASTRHRALVGALACGCILVRGTASAQQRALRVDDLAPTVFGRAEALPTVPILGLSLDHARTMWVATEQGPRQFDGSGWAHAGLPASAVGRTTRAMREAPNGVLWIAQNSQVLSRDGGTWAVHPFADSARMGPIYSMVLTDALGTGNPEVVVGARGGVFRVVPGGRPWQQLTIPGGFVASSAVVATREEGSRQPELWVASIGSGVARLRAGAWRTWGHREGLDTIVEHVALAPPGDSISALVATQSGAFALRGEHWHRIGPRIQATRVLRFRVHDHVETWIGSLAGEVLRSRDGITWDTIDVTERMRGSRVQVLEAVDAGLATPSVFVGFRSGILMRYRVGVAGRLLAPTTIRGRLVADVLLDSTGGDVWLWVVGAGAVRTPSFAVPPIPDAMRPMTGVRPRLLAPSGDRNTTLLAAAGQEVWRLRGGQWSLLHRLAPDDTVRALLEAATADGAVRPVLVTSRGGYSLAPGGFVVWDGFPPNAIAAVVDSAGGERGVIVLDRDRAVWRLANGAWVRLQAGSPPVVGNVHGLTIVSHSSGERSLWMGMVEGVAVMRFDGGPPAWRVLDAASIPALRTSFVRDVRAIDDTLVAIGTSGGLVVVDAGEFFAGSITTAGAYTEADGLPHMNVTAIGSLDRAGRLWLGTETGAGFVDRLAIGRDNPGSDALALTIRGADNAIVPEGRDIPWSSRSLSVALRFPTAHREEDTRFRLELDGAPVNADDWSDVTSATLLAMEPGRHELRSWAMDWRGQVNGPVVRSLTILPPWYRSTLAWAAYAALVVATWWAVAEARVRRVRARTAAIVANERRLAGSELRFRRLFEGGVNPQLLVQDQRIIRANTAAIQLLAPDDLRGLVDHPLDDLLPGVSLDLLTDGPDGAPRELVARAAGRVFIPVEVRATVITLDQDTVTHVQLRDLRDERRLEAERRSLQEQLFESQRLESLGTLAGGVAHDFNNLLTVIQGNAELVIDRPESADTTDSLRQILAATARARDIVKQILTYSRRSNSVLSPVPLSQLLDETHRMLRATIPATVRVEVVDQADDAVIHGDPTQLHQMLLNLATNAEHAMRPTGGGTLTISTDWVPRVAGELLRDVAIRVRDTGVGMTPEVQARVFEPFYTTKPVGQGTGLGLSVLHGIVGVHGGSVHVESEVGVGTTFEVRLPATAARVSDGEWVEAVSPGAVP